jgi:UDPglucose 6-dehydrogenase
MQPRRAIAVVGSGYVGTVVAACFAFLDREVIAVEADDSRLASLRAGRAPWHEPMLDQLLVSSVEAGRLRFTNSISEAMAAASTVFVCVGAPSGPDGRPDMRQLEVAGRAIGSVATDHVVVNKSTVPIGGEQWLASIMEDARPRGTRAAQLPGLVANPEFLREGSAVSDFLHPDRVVLGSRDDRALDFVAEAYRPILEQTFPGGDPARRPVLVRTTAATAEAIKYASNAFLATKLSFINEVANIFGRVGVDVRDVAAAMGLDPRIGAHFLRAGIGWGGSCLGKDLAALVATARDHNYEPYLLEAVAAVNERQRAFVIQALRNHFLVLQGRRIALLGLAFKADTDDVRDSPAVDVARRLFAHGAVVSAHDPAVRSVPEIGALTVEPDPYRAVEQADAVVVTTPWPQFAELDYKRVLEQMRGALIIDSCNLLDSDEVETLGFRYERLGTGSGRNGFTDQRRISVVDPEGLGLPQSSWPVGPRASEGVG